MPSPDRSGRNQGWMKKNPWFHDDVVPAVGNRIAELLDEYG